MKLSDLGQINKEDILALLGLQKEPTATERWLERVSSFGVGLLVGAGVSLLFAPKSGQELRQDLGERLRGLKLGDDPLNTSTDPFTAQSEYSK